MRRAVRAIVIKDDALLVMHRNKFGEEYYTLCGGGVKAGEAPEQALQRELYEETGLPVANPRLVFVEEAGDPFGTQYIFLADYTGGEVKLSPESDEAKIHALGQNLYTPMWLLVKDLPDVPFMSEKLKQAIINSLLHGFPQQPLGIN